MLAGGKDGNGIGRINGRDDGNALSCHVGLLEGIADGATVGYIRGCFVGRLLGCFDG